VDACDKDTWQAHGALMRSGGTRDWSQQHGIFAGRHSAFAAGVIGLGLVLGEQAYVIVGG
jgi:hypothetical protein